MSSGGRFVWASPTESATSEVVEAAAREFGLALRHCSHARLLDVVREEGCEIVGIEFGARRDDALALVREVHSRAPRLTIFAAAEDGSLELLRAALEAGATDFFSIPLRPSE